MPRIGPMKRLFLVLKSPRACANLNFLMTEQAANLLRELPSVDRLLKHARCEALLIRYNRDYIIQKCREILEELRADIKQGKKAASDDSITDAAVLSRWPAGQFRIRSYGREAWTPRRDHRETASGTDRS